MCVAEELCDELFAWLDQLDRCADRLMALAKELEEMREAITAGQLVGNTAAVLGSLTLVGTGIATLLTGGLAAPGFLVAAGSIAAGAGAVTSITLTLIEKWKSSDKMKDAERTIDKTKKTEEKIKRLQRKLTEECEVQGLKASTSEEVQCEITVRILRALAKRSGRDLPLSRLRNLFRSGLMSGTPTGFSSSNTVFLESVSVLLLMLGYTHILLLSAAGKGAIGLGGLFGAAAAKGMSSEFAQLAGLSLKTVLKGSGQVAGGVIGLVLTVPDLIENCEELIKNKHETEASNYLRKKANEIREDLRQLKKHLNEIQETLKELPEMEYHISLTQNMIGSQVYTQGIVCIEYKQTRRRKESQPWKQSYIFLSTKDMGTSQSDHVSKRKTDDKRNKRQKSTSPTKEQNRTSGQHKNSQRREFFQQLHTSQPWDLYRLPKITMSNVRSLPNKMEELKEMLKNDDEFGNSDLMFFTETWLTRNSPTINLESEGFRCYRVDRDAQRSQKRRGGGLLMFVNENWATDVVVEDVRITPDYEVMVVTIRPHDHPEGAPPLTFIHVYVPGPDFALAANDIAEYYYDALARTGGGPIFLLGDFNQCNLSSVLRGLEQYVTCPTRINNTIDLCYGNVTGAYRSECRRPLGRSDHNVVHLIPKRSKSAKNDKDAKCSHGRTRSKEE